MYRDAKPTLAGGEISEAVAARYDVSKYATALARARNTLGLPQGGQYIRAGFLFGDEIFAGASRAVLLPFIFSSGDAYSVEFTPGKMRLFYRGQLVTRPRLTITGISKAVQAVVTCAAHGYVVGWTVVFDGVAGMIEINGLRGTVTAVSTDTFTVDIDTRAFGTFSGDTGGVGGASAGGTGGYPPEPPPGEDPPPPETPDDPLPPPTDPGGGGCPAPEVLVLLANEALDGPGEEVPAGDVVEGRDYVWTRHERTGEWGAFFVLKKTIIHAAQRHKVVMEDGREGVYALRHRFFVEATRYTCVEAIAPGTVIDGFVPGVLASISPAEPGPVVEFMVHKAKTLQTGGLHSHNRKPSPKVIID